MRRAIETVMIRRQDPRSHRQGRSDHPRIIGRPAPKIDVDDTGRVSVASCDGEGLKKALEPDRNITAVPEIGKTYLGKVCGWRSWRFVRAVPRHGMGCCTSRRSPSIA